MSEPAQLSGRLVSLDVFRGMTIAAMLLVNNPGTWAHIYTPLDHAEWHGWTPTDLIFPFFLFIVGVSMTFSFGKRMAKESKRALLRDTLRRSGIIFALGILLSLFPRFDFANLRLVGVLPRIAIVYLISSILFLYLSRKTLVWITGGLLIGYWLLMKTVPVPGYGAGVLTPEGNFAAWLDGYLVPGRIYQGTWDPEGFTSTLPAIATTLLGIFTGDWIRSDRDRQTLAQGMFAAGWVAVAVGLAWNLFFPINKNLWTSSYVVFTAGAAWVILSLCYWLIDIKGYHRWARPFVVFGVNAIAAFVLSGLITRILLFAQVTIGDGSIPAKKWIFDHWFAPLAAPVNASLLYAFTQLLAVWLIMALLYRKRIFIKV